VVSFFPFGGNKTVAPHKARASMSGTAILRSSLTIMATILSGAALMVVAWVLSQPAKSGPRREQTILESKQTNTNLQYHIMKGPKAILSSAIATALNEFFYVDKDLMESKLLGDAKIVLKDIQLRPLKAVKIPSHPSSTADISGQCSLVTFRWNWTAVGGLLGSGGWVKDATLTIESLHIQVKLSEDSNEEDSVSQLAAGDKIQQAAQEHAEAGELEQHGGLRVYI
jgi:hypothetical protein